jgi:hypothetical protein
MRLRIYIAWLAAWLFAWCAFGQPMPTEAPPSVPKGRTVTLAWDASATPGCTYTLYWGSTEAFSNVVDCGTNRTATLTGLPMRCDLMFCVSASANGLESDPSNEVSVRRYAPKTNIVVRITGEHMQTGPTVRGPWTPFGSTTILLTNPSATLFWRGAKLERWLQ